MYQVNLQAEADFRNDVEDILNLYARSSSGAMVPLRTVLTTTTILAPYSISRYNLSTAAPVNSMPAPGASSGDAMMAVERIAAESLPQGYSYAWSGLSFPHRGIRQGTA